MEKSQVNWPNENSTSLSQRKYEPKGNIYLTLKVPSGKKRDMCRILKPIVKEARGLASFIHVTEASLPTSSPSQRVEYLDSHVPNYTVASQELSAPSLALMLFLSDNPQHSPNAASLRQRLHKFPWRLHHSIQLQAEGNKSANVLGQQEFYFLSRQLPLWNVSPSLKTSDLIVRFNIFVRRFSAMVEFYRLVTGSEMESRKPGFCLFPLNCEGGEHQAECSSDPGVRRPYPPCELVLKHCPLVNPFPLTDAHLSFPVNDLQTVLNVLTIQPKPLSCHQYLVYDPDGNPVILYERQSKASDSVKSASRTPTDTHENGQARLGLDKNSERSFSSDSGRFSDFEVNSLELETCMSRLVEAVGLLQAERSDTAEEQSHHQRRPHEARRSHNTHLRVSQGNISDDTKTLCEKNPYCFTGSPRYNTSDQINGVPKSVRSEDSNNSLTLSSGYISGSVCEANASPMDIYRSSYGSQHCQSRVSTCENTAISAAQSTFCIHTRHEHGIHSNKPKFTPSSDINHVVSDKMSTCCSNRSHICVDSDNFPGLRGEQNGWLESEPNSQGASEPHAKVNEREVPRRTSKMDMLKVKIGSLDILCDRR